VKLFELFKPRNTPHTARSAPLAAALEPRMMFDGAIAATAAEATASAEHPTTDPAKTQTADDSTQPASDAATPPAASSDQRQEIVFVDGKLQDYQQLVSEIKPGTEVVVLDGSRGGLQQIAEYLNGRSGIDAIHLLSHGEAGVFRAGSDWIDANALAAQSATLARIGAALSENGDILLYGCKTGEGAAGAALVNELARLTQADVAASSDNTGALALGGDWILETRSGSIDSIALAPTAFSGLLAAPTSLNFDSVNLDADGDGDPTRSLGGSPWVFDGWTVTLHNSAGAIVTVDTQDYLYVTNNTGDNVLVDGDGDKALTVHGFYGIAASARFTATSGEEFWLQSFVIENISMSTGIRVEGYREGDLVASHNFTLNNGSGVYSTSTITLDHLGDQDWQNIDQFRIVQQNGSPGLWFVIDDIVVASKVLPNTPPTATNLTQSKTVTEGGGAVALDDIVVSDPDTGDNITATLTLSSPAAGSLSTGTFGSATSTYNPGTGVWNVSGSRTDVNAALAAVALTPSADNEQNFTISTRIHDAANSGPADGSITVSVTAVNDAPTVANPIPNQAASEDAAFSLVVPSNTFSDADGDSLTYTAQLAGGGALPTWLSFDPSTGTFSGTPTNGDVGTLSIDVIASDGNGGSVTDTFSITVNTLSPRITDITSSTANGTYKVDDTITISITFDEVVTVNTTGGVPTLLLETGPTDRIASYVSGSGSNTLTFSYTVQAGDSSADLDYASTSALSLNGGTIKDGANQNAILTLAAPGAAGSLGTDKALVVDGVRPAATSITLSDTALSIGQTATVTITFNERVSGLSTSDFTVANGSLSNFSSDSGLTWTATFTPSANVSDATNLITLDNTGVQDLAGNTGTGTTVSGNYTIDTESPTASIVIADTELKAGQSTTVTITFSEAVSGLTRADFSAANGTLSNLTTSDNITWTATLTPDANVTDATNLITLDNFGYTDIAGNPGDAPTDSNNYAIDTQRPTAISVQVTDTTLKAGQSTAVTITFSEAVRELDTADFSVANGTLSNLSSSDGGITWTATLTPAADVTDATNLITLDNTGYTDAAGNTGTGTADSNNYAIDSKAPTVTSVNVPANGTYVAGDALDFTVNFDEAVLVNTSNGTPRLAITLDTGGTVYANYLSGSGSSTLVFRLNVANGQQDGNGIAIGTNLQANGATLRDAAGNDTGTILKNLGLTTAVLVDALAPQITGITLDGTSPTNSSTLGFTVTFSEDVNGVDLTDFALATTGSANGTLLSLVQVDARTYRITVDGVTGQGMIGLSLTAAGSGIVDNVGNAMLSNFSSPSYTIDSQRPTATITVADTSLSIGETTTVTITFSEAVTGLSLADFSVANGTLSNLRTSDNITYTATLTPTANVADSSNLITLDNTGVQDAAGNTGLGNTNSNNYGIDTTQPRVPINDGDPEFRINPPTTTPGMPTHLPPVVVPSAPPTSVSDSPLLPPPLFEVRTVGGDLPPLGTIFLGNSSSQPSFIAQVFGTSDTGLGGDSQGFLGFGDSGIFGSSTFATIFGRDVPGVSEMNVFSGSQWKQSDLNQGLRGVFGAPTFGQQLHELHEGEQRQLRELALALGQLEGTPTQA
jgi:hypothetical protein